MAKNDRKRLLRKIDKKLKIKPKSETFYLFRKHSKLTVAKSDEVIESLNAIAKKQSLNTQEVQKIKKYLDKFKVEIPKQFDVKVLNQVEIPKEVKINNFPNKLNFKEPTWLEKIYKPIVDEIKKIEIPKVNLDKYTTAKNPLSVRLSDGKKFLEQLTTLTQVAQGGTVDQETKDILQLIANASGGLEQKTATSWQFFAENDLAYTVNRTNITIVGQAESDFILLENPTSSTDMRIKDILISVNTGSSDGTFRLYKDPTITTNGVALMPINYRDTSVNSVMNAYADPVVSARGTVFRGFGEQTGTFLKDDDLSMYILPGEFLLISIQPSSNNKNFSVNISYAEETQTP